MVQLSAVAIISLGAALAACHSSPAPGKDDSLPAGWTDPFEPFRIAGNLYYVGAKNVASYLFVTPAGDVLLDSGTPAMTPMIRGNIEKLGFKVADIKILLDSHAHFDHVGGHAALKQASGAQVMVMRGDADAVAAGVDRSPLAGAGWAPVAVDRVLEDGATVVLGDTTLTAVAAPGHTPGCTVWTTQIAEADKHYAVVFYGCSRPNDGVALLHNPRFPQLIEDTLATLRKMRTLAPDIVLTMHPEEVFAGKLDALRAGTRPHPLEDRAAWPKLLDEVDADFTGMVERARAADASTK